MLDERFFVKTKLCPVSNSISYEVIFGIYDQKKPIVEPTSNVDPFAGEDKVGVGICPFV